MGPPREVVWQAGPASASAPPGERPPNIVVILADDLGWNDLTFAGGGVAGGSVPTPNIDGIARDGVTFSNGYAAQATCAPSRAALLTGRYPTRSGFEFTPAGIPFMRGYRVLQPPCKCPRPSITRSWRRATPRARIKGLPPSEITLAELLRERGYHTLHLGKWHLGEAAQFRPEAQGFDESLGFYAGGSMFLPEDDANVVNSKQDFDPIDRFLWANLPFMVRLNGSDPFRPSAYMTDYLADEAVRAIAANRNRPFFLYLAFNAPHTPLQALARGLRRARPDREPQRARLRRDDRGTSTARWAACSRRCARRGSKTTRWSSSRATTAARATWASRASTSPSAAGR